MNSEHRFKVHNISHIVANGCSYTYGQELDDPKTQSWPALLAKKMNLNLVNIARPASGNDAILRRTVDYYFQNLVNNSTPLFVIALSYHTRREEYFYEYDDYKNLVRYDNVEQMNCAEKHFFLNSNANIRQKEKMFHWLHLINFLKLNNLPYIIGDYMPDGENLSYVYPELYNLLKNDVNYCGELLFLTDHLPRKPNYHDGEEAQEIISDTYFNSINNNYKFNIIKNAKYVKHDDFFTEQQRERFKTQNSHHWIGT